MKTVSASSYIKKALKSLVLLFPETRVRYEYDIDAEAHCVEVMPSRIYHLNTLYLDWEDGIINDFIEAYPDQNIYFFSDDSIVGISNIDFEISGNAFEELNATKEFQFLQNIVTQYSISETAISSLKGLNTFSNNLRVTNDDFSSLLRHSESGFKIANSLPTNNNFMENKFCDITLMVA
jgi:hypothetical protein